MLGPGDLVLLRGDLGTGKTTLVRAAARALGVAGPVTSPTFTLRQSYDGRVPVVHVDGYRLGAGGGPGARAPDAEELGLVLGDADAAVTFVEWPDALAEGLPTPRVEVDLRHRGGDRRLVRLSAASPPTRTELARLVADLRPGHRHPPPEPGSPGGDGGSGG